MYTTILSWLQNDFCWKNHLCSLEALDFDTAFVRFYGRNRYMLLDWEIFNIALQGCIIYDVCGLELVQFRERGFISLHK